MIVWIQVKYAQMGAKEEKILFLQGLKHSMNHIPVKYFKVTWKWYMCFDEWNMNKQ
jgi:hypothetical protein